MAHSDKEQELGERAFSFPFLGTRKRIKSDKEKYLQALKKQELVQKMIDNENKIEELKSDMETLRTTSDRRISELKMKSESIQKANTKEITERDKRIKTLENKLSHFQKDVFRVIEKNRNVHIFGGRFVITASRNTQTGKTNVIENEKETLQGLEEFLNDVRVKYSKILQKWAEAKQELKTMKDTLKQTLEKVEVMSKGHTDVAENVSVVLEMVSLSQDKICEKGFNVIKEWNIPQDDVTADCLPHEAAALHRLVVAKYTGKNESRLGSAFGQNISTDGATFSNQCAKWLFSWIKANKDRSSSHLLNLLKDLDEEILAEDAQDIVNDANRSLSQSQENNEISEHLEETEITNTHLLQKLSQHQEMLVKIMDKQDELSYKLFMKNKDNEGAKSSASTSFQRSVVTIV